MPFHRIYHQFGVVAIKGKGFPGEFWLSSEFAPGKGEGQEHIYGDISGATMTEEGWDS